MRNSEIILQGWTDPECRNHYLTDPQGHLAVTLYMAQSGAREYGPEEFEACINAMFQAPYVNSADVDIFIARQFTANRSSAPLIEEIWQQIQASQS